MSPKGLIIRTTYNHIFRQACCKQVSLIRHGNHYRWAECWTLASKCLPSPTNISSFLLSSVSSWVVTCRERRSKTQLRLWLQQLCGTAGCHEQLGCGLEASSKIHLQEEKIKQNEAVEWVLRLSPGRQQPALRRSSWPFAASALPPFDSPQSEFLNCSGQPLHNVFAKQKPLPTTKGEEQRHHHHHQWWAALQKALWKELIFSPHIPNILAFSSNWRSETPKSESFETWKEQKCPNRDLWCAMGEKQQNGCSRVLCPSVIITNLWFAC